MAKISKGFWWQPIALLCVAAYWIYIAKDIPTPNAQTVEKYGVYGDSFGQLTSIFTALGFGGLIITLLLQQKQIHTQEKAAQHTREKEERGRYEEIFFRLMDIYRQTLFEVQVGDMVGRDVLRKALERVDYAVIEERVHDLPKEVKSRSDALTLTEADLQYIDYLYFRNFKIVATEIHPQARLIDTLEVLLEHVVSGRPEHLLSNTYKDLLWAQITFIESRYFFMVALSHTSRVRLRSLLAQAGFFDRFSRSQTHKIHREMYTKYWGFSIAERDIPASMPMSQGQIKRAVRAFKAAGGVPKTTYTPIGVRLSEKPPTKL